MKHQEKRERKMGPQETHFLIPLESFFLGVLGNSYPDTTGTAVQLWLHWDWPLGRAKTYKRNKKKMETFTLWPAEAPFPGSLAKKNCLLGVFAVHAHCVVLWPRLPQIKEERKIRKLIISIVHSSSFDFPLQPFSQNGLIFNSVLGVAFCILSKILYFGIVEEIACCVIASWPVPEIHVFFSKFIFVFVIWSVL